MNPEQLIEIAKELVAADDAKNAHMIKWPEWWAEGKNSFDEGKEDREPNREWSAICDREFMAKIALIDTARQILARISSAPTSPSESTER